MPRLNMRLFPIVFGTSAVICINILSYYRNGFPILSSLGSLALTMLIFIFLITLIDRLNRSDFKIVDTRQSNLPQNDLSQNDLPQGNLPQDGLFEIKKENVSQVRLDAGTSLEKQVYQSVYIISFLGIAFWRTIGIFKAAPLSYVGQYRAGIVDALLLFVLPCGCVLYLKMRKDGLYPSDKITQDILSFFSYTSFFYAAVIAAAVVLKINILGILPPLFYAASAYLTVSLAVNIVISMLKGNILSFDYTLFPKITRIKDKTNLYAETQEAKWNVSIKSLYTIKYTITILPALLLVLIFILFLSTTIFTVQPHQQAAVYRFGKLDRSSIKNEGAHFKFPWPIEKTEIYDVHRVSSMQIGYESSGTANFLWTKTHDGGEYMLLLGNGNEMAAVNLKIMYVISDLYLYIKSCTNPEAVLNAAAYNALMSRTVNTTLDSFLNVDRNSLSVSVLEELSQVCTAENMGFSVVQVIIESIHPPVEIADVYQKVVSASVDKTTLITRAQAYAEAKIIEAHRQSKTAVEQARAMQYSKISNAQKEAAVFYAATEAYRISGGSFELTRYLDVYEKIISGNKVYVFSPGTEKNISKFIIGKVNTVNFLNVNNGGGNE